LPVHRSGAVHSLTGQGVGRADQGALRALPQGARQAGREDRRHPQTARLHMTAIEKVSIIVSKGSLEGVYPALIMANGARMEGIEANLFFTFFGMDAITKKWHEHIKVATVGNPGLHLATIVGSLPGMPGLMTGYLGHKM